MRSRTVNGEGASPSRIGLLLLCACCACLAHAQSSTRSTSPTITPVPDASGRIDSGSGMPSDQGYDMPQSLRILRQNARRDDMKRRMEQNATRLLQLTAELRNDLQTREPTEADGKRLDEIAKLAHSVREQMKQ